ncbi:MAG: hypothetical protein ABT00_20255 [Bordetella sp. SCN 68-11]|nr:MAG: hypothetical protein ABT00_20255 [Bordetella sp. SCN 68-11]
MLLVVVAEAGPLPVAACVPVLFYATFRVSTQCRATAMPARTVADFAASGLPVSLSCSACGRVQVPPPDVLDAAFGPDFDLVAHHREVSRRLCCAACGEPRPAVLLDAAAVAEPVADPARRRA